MRLYVMCMLLATTAFGSSYVCTARSLLGKAYHAVGIDQELVMLDALKQCETANLRCVRGDCRQTSLPADSDQVYEVGDTVQNMCWSNDENKQVCLDDFKDTVRVLVYNAGWCGPCNNEFDELSPRVGLYAGKPVTFISLSASGYSRTSPPDQRFLQSWRQRHGIPASFVVAGAPRDYGSRFGQNAIPNAAVVGKDGKLTFKDVAPGVDGLFQEIDKALAK